MDVEKILLPLSKKLDAGELTQVSDIDEMRVRLYCTILFGIEVYSDERFVDFVSNRLFCKVFP
jgi:hypothetical protein